MQQRPRSADGVGEGLVLDDVGLGSWEVLFRRFGMCMVERLGLGRRLGRVRRMLLLPGSLQEVEMTIRPQLGGVLGFRSRTR